MPELLKYCVKVSEECLPVFIESLLNLQTDLGL